MTDNPELMRNKLSRYFSLFLKKDTYVYLPVILSFTIWSGCAVIQKTRGGKMPAFYIAGHRGAAGLMPEETIAAMKKGIEVGANTLEFDLYVTKDGKVILHHDPSFNPAFERMPDGSAIPRAQRERFTFYKMNYADIRKFIVGGKKYAVFPGQKRIKTYIPLLSEMIDSVEAFTRLRRLKPIVYMPEIGGSPAWIGTANPPEEEFVKIVMKTLKPYLPQIGNRLIIQCFDQKILQILHRDYPSIPLALLVGNNKISFKDNIAELGFVPAFYLPYYKQVTVALVKKCHESQVKIIPWTVDDSSEMKELISMGVDGIITNYPDRLAGLKRGVSAEAANSAGNLK